MPIHNLTKGTLLRKINNICLYKRREGFATKYIAVYPDGTIDSGELGELCDKARNDTRFINKAKDTIVVRFTSEELKYISKHLKTTNRFGRINNILNTKVE